MAISHCKVKKNLRENFINISMMVYLISNIFEPQHEISNNVVCATSKVSDQPAHTRCLIRAFAYGLNIL